MTRFRNVLVLGAHPDDEMGCAGFVYRLSSEGSNVEALTFSQCLDLNPRDLLNEWVRALDLIGVSSRFGYDLPNRMLPQHAAEIRTALDERVGLYDLVLCPASTDTHQDHATVAAEAKRVFKTTTVLGYELPLNQNGQPGLNTYAKLTPMELDIKIRHAEIYRTQVGKAYMDPAYIEGLARVRGLQCGAMFAEAFEVIRWVL